jgi:hypothetical protein
VLEQELHHLRVAQAGPVAVAQTQSVASMHTSPWAPAARPDELHYVASAPARGTWLGPEGGCLDARGVESDVCEDGQPLLLKGSGPPTRV